ncbi:MAG: hypothetical protein KAS32_00975, partial [Candidatus Peribacteraceae bacterium]|nr:hypothetical protein [Candidatus Peribacteraceae bacterium]
MLLEGGAWTEITPYNDTTGVNKTVTFQKTFQFTEMGNLTFKFNATDDDSNPIGGGAQYSDEILSGFNFTLEADDAALHYVAGNYSTVNRVGSNTATLSLLLVDTDKNNVTITSSEQGTMWITTNETDPTSWRDLAPTWFAGTLTKNFDPDCNWETGNQTWKGGTVAGTGRYKFVNSSEYNVTITSVYTPYIDYPKNISFVREEDAINLSMNLTDDGACGLVDGATVQFEVKGRSYVKTANDFGNGWYNYTITQTDLSSWPYGWYNISVNATRNYYPSDVATDYNNSFYLASRPSLAGEAVTTGACGSFWGCPANFTVEITDNDNGNVSVFLWKKKGIGGEWEYLGNGSCGPCSSTQIKVEVQFNCTDVGTSYYKFNATDVWNYTTDTGENDNPFTISPNVASLSYVTPNDITIQRQGSVSQNLTVLLTDTTRSVPVLNDTNATIYITNDSMVFVEVYNGTTNSSGHFSYDLEPDCTYEVGPQKWKVDLQNDECYYDVSSSPPNFTVNVAGQLKTTIDVPEYQSEYQTTTQIPIRFNVTSDCSNENRINDTETSVELYSPSAAYETCTPRNNETGSNAGYYNCTWDSTDKTTGMWGIRLNASKGNYTSNSTLYLQMINLTNAAPTYNSMDVTPDQAGWGTLFNFTINVTDADDDPVNCTLLVTTNDGASWEDRGSMNVASGVGWCWIEVTDFSCPDIGTDNWYKFTLDDGYISIESDNSSEPNITVDSVGIIYLQGNNTNINRSTQSVSLQVNFTDTITNEGIDSVDVYFNNTKNGINYTNLVEKTTSSGVATYTFTPDCTYNATNQLWNAFINNSCYANTTSDGYNFNVLGHYDNTIVQPLGEEYLKGTNITIRVNISDQYCGPLDSQDMPTSVNISFKNQLTGAWYTCTPIDDDTGGFYNCTFNTSAYPPRGYNLLVYASKSYFNTYNSTVTYTAGQTNGFFIETEPTIEYPQMNTTGYDGDTGPNGSWSEPKTYTVNLTDEDGDLVTIRLWKRKYSAGWGSWEQVGNPQYINNPNNTAVVFVEPGNTTSQYATPDDLAIWQYKFNSTDDEDNPTSGGAQYYARLNGTNYTVDKDDMQIEYYNGSEVTIWRNDTGNSIFSTKVWSIDQQRYLGAAEADGMTWITKDGSTFINLTTPGDILTDGGGYLNYTTFDPDCTYGVGVQYWKTGVEANDDYKDTNSSAYYNVTLWTFLNGTINSPSGGIYLRDSDINVTFNVSIFDECDFGVTSPGNVNITLNVTGVPEKFKGSTSVEDLGGGIYFYNWSTTDLDTLDFYNMTFDIYKNYYDGKKLYQELAFRLVESPLIEYLDPSLQTSGDGGWGESYNFRIRSRKDDALPYNVSLWYKNNQSSPGWELLEKKELQSSGFGWNYTDFQSDYFNCTDITPTNDNSTFKINASDQFSFTYELAEVNFTIDKDDINIYYETGLNEQINREGATTGLFRVRINDTDRGVVGVGDGVSGILYVTVDTANYETLYYNNTDAYSKLLFNFDPNCTHGYGQQSWIAGVSDDSCYKDTNATSRNFYVIGQLKNWIDSPNWTSGQPEYNVTDQILVRLNTTSECISQEGLISNTEVGIILQSPNGSNYTCTPRNNETTGGWYNCTWDSSDQAQGNWTINLTSGRQYFVDNE